VMVAAVASGALREDSSHHGVTDARSPGRSCRGFLTRSAATNFVQVTETTPGPVLDSESMKTIRRGGIVDDCGRHATVALGSTFSPTYALGRCLAGAGIAEFGSRCLGVVITPTVMWVPCVAPAGGAQRGVVAGDR